MRPVVAVVLMLLFSAGSAGQADALTYPGQHPAPLIQTLLVQEAETEFWGAPSRMGPDYPDQYCPDGIKVWQAPSLPGGDIDAGQRAWARGWRDPTTGVCETWLTDSLVETEGMLSLLDECAAITHEVGHALGLPHVRSGVMAGKLADGTPPLAEPAPYAWTPWFCRKWALDEEERQALAEGATKREAADWRAGDREMLEMIQRRIDRALARVATRPVKGVVR